MTDDVRDYTTRFDVTKSIVDHAARDATKAATMGRAASWGDAIESVDDAIQMLESIRAEIQEDRDDD